MDLIDKLGIDLKLLIAQIVNFVILLVILTKLIYKPLLKLLDDRKKMIAKTVDDSKRIEDRLAAIEADRDKVLANASKEAMVIVERAKKEKKWKPVPDAPLAKMIQLKKLYVKKPEIIQTLELYEQI